MEDISIKYQKSVNNRGINKGSSEIWSDGYNKGVS